MGYCCVSFQTRHGNLRPDKSWWVPTNLSCHLSDPIPHSHLHVRKAPTGRAIYFQLLAAKDRLKCWFLLLSTAQTKNIGQNGLNTIFHGNEPPFPVSYPLTAILVGFLWFFPTFGRGRLVEDEISGFTILWILAGDAQLPLDIACTL